MLGDSIRLPAYYVLVSGFGRGDITGGRGLRIRSPLRPLAFGGAGSLLLAPPALSFAHGALQALRAHYRADGLVSAPPHTPSHSRPLRPSLRSVRTPVYLYLYPC